MRRRHKIALPPSDLYNFHLGDIVQQHGGRPCRVYAIDVANGALCLIELPWWHRIALWVQDVWASAKARLS